jgi:hypothetical protein
MQESRYGLPSAELISFWTFHGGTAIQGMIRLRYVKKNLESAALFDVEASIEEAQEQKWKCFRISCKEALR